MNLIQKHSLRSLNTLAIDSVADFFVEAVSLDDVQSALSYAKQHNLAVKVLGGGSNVVMADRISGLVLKYTASEYRLLSETNETVTIVVDAGFEWHAFVLFCLNKGWFGLENLSYIPGTVGAAPVQNIGAYGVEVKDVIQRVHGVYLETGETFTLDADECDFSYRESIFKQALNNQTLITSVEFILSKQANVQVGYAPLNSMASEQGMPTPLQLSQWVVEVRQSKLPEPSKLPNAGSFFKNPVVSLEKFETIQQANPDIPNYPQSNSVKLPAGWLIDQLGLKGKSFGSVSVHDKQALVLVNHGGTCVDVEAAANEIKRQVKGEYGIELEQEPRVFS